MKRVSEVSAVVLLAGALSPAYAGTLYIPVVDQYTAQGLSLHTQVFVTNPGSAEAFVVVGKEVLTVPPGQTLSLPAGAGDSMLAVTADPSLVLSSRLAASDVDGRPVAGDELPLLSATSAGEAGDVVSVAGLSRRALGASTDLGLVNLGEAEANCTLSFADARGTLIAHGGSVVVAAGAQARVEDVLSLSGKDELQDARVEVKCDQPFHVYASELDADSGTLRVVRGKAQDYASLNGAGDIVLQVPGVVHIPTPANPTRRFMIPEADGLSFHKVHVAVDFTHNGWFKGFPYGYHSIFWMMRGHRQNKPIGNNVGYGNLRGPGSNKLVVASNVSGVNTHGRAGRVWEVGRAYHAEYVFDTQAGTASLTVTSVGFPTTSVSFPTKVPVISPDPTSPTNAWFIDMAVAMGVELERPTYGWVYSNLLVELFH